MKKIFTISFVAALLTVSIKMHAQLVTISGTHQFPAFGDTIHYINANTFGFTPAGTGPVTNTLWDESFLLNAGTTYDFFYVDPATITGFGVDSFPTANMARGESGAPGYFYYANTATDLNRVGWFSTNMNYGIYENATYSTEFHFPITAGQTFTSTYNGRYAPFGVGEDSTKIESGSISVNADAQGTLILPTGTFTNVLRMHVLENFHIKIYLLGVPVIDYLVSDDYYYWFHDTILQPVLIYGITTIDGTPQTPVLRYQPLSGSTGITSQEDISGVTISPNPSNGNFLVRNFDINNSNNKIEIFTIAGQKVNFEAMPLGISTMIKIANASRGIYFMQLSDGENVFIKKIAVE